MLCEKKKMDNIYDILFPFVGTIEDYKLLETLNKITITKYTDMKEFTENISRGLQELNEKCKSAEK